jgi:hypothetical protein
MVPKGEPLDGAFKILALAVRIAIAWTLLSLLLLACWAVLLAFGRRFGSRPALPPEEELQLSAEVRAIYADFDDEGPGGEALVHCEPDETAGSDTTAIRVGTGSARKR